MLVIFIFHKNLALKIICPLLRKLILFDIVSRHYFIVKAINLDINYGL